MTDFLLFVIALLMVPWAIYHSVMIASEYQTIQLAIEKRILTRYYFQQLKETGKINEINSADSKSKSKQTLV